jgi:hypothetical protein
MKKNIFLFTMCCMFATISLAQAPQKINYQAVARDGAGAISVSRPITVRFTLHDASPTGAVIYQESHSTTTNQFGLFTLAIGGGIVISGTFASINWGLNDKYLQVEFDPAGGTGYINMGTAQLLSVPYALYALNSNGWA